MDESIILLGPYKDKSKKIVSYITNGTFKGNFFNVVFIGSDDDFTNKIIKINYVEFFNIVIDSCSRNLNEFNKIKIYYCLLNKNHNTNGYNFEMYLAYFNEDNPEKIAYRLMDNTYSKKRINNDENSIYINNFGKYENTNLYQYEFENLQKGYSKYILSKNQEDITIISDLENELDFFSMKMYYDEIINYISSNKADEAFHSYTHFMSLFNFRKITSEDNNFDVVAISKSLINLLFKYLKYDYAELVSKLAVKSVLKKNDFSSGVEFYQLQGISNEGVGRLNDSINSYKKALSISDKLSNNKKIAMIYRSFGITSVFLTLHLDYESLSHKKNKNTQNILFNSAKDYLEKAYSFYNNFSDDNTEILKLGIKLDLLHIDDLLGNHEVVYNALEKLFNENKILNRNPKLLSTGLIYICFVLKNMYKKNIEYRDLYYKYLKASEIVIMNENNVFFDKICILNILIGDELAKESNEEALKYFNEAYKIQSFIRMNEIRTSGPDTVYGGYLAMDVVARIHELIFQTEYSKIRNDIKWNCLNICESEKGRFFKRDLFFSDKYFGNNFKNYLYKKFKKMKDMLSKNKLDQRLIMADYNYFLNKNISSVDRKKLVTFDDNLKKLLDYENMGKIFSDCDGKVAILSFYTTEKRTYIHILQDYAKSIKIIVLDINDAEIIKISRSLYIGIHGGKYNQKISYTNPQKSNNFFEKLFELRILLKPLIKELENKEKIYICPHRSWHSIPLHALLLPVLWEKGKKPGIIYSPGIHILQYLNNRFFKNKPYTKTGLGIATVWAKDDEEDPFMKSHNLYLNVFKNTKRPIHSCYGKKATEIEVLEKIAHVDLYHITGHGIFYNSENAMNSGILLAEQDCLPDKKNPPSLTGLKIMVNDISSNHVTLQACSIGKRIEDKDDEFWGFVRSLISAGVNSILAPLWDINIVSSTKFLETFYSKWLIEKFPKWKAFAEAQYIIAHDKKDESLKHFVNWGAFQLIE